MTKIEVLGSHGATGEVMSELLEYDAPRFPKAVETEFPLKDEAHIDYWEQYKEESLDEGVIPTLSRHFPQLRFPIVSGISKRRDYRAATLRGEDRSPYGQLDLVAPEAVTLSIHPTPAGRIPIIVASEREDFVRLVRALGSRNEPTVVPDSMGASTITGLINWDRVHRFRDDWKAKAPNQNRSWAKYFPSFAKQRKLYQDTLIILSTGDYSGVSAAQLGCSDTDWVRESHTIRTEHECVHYFTLRVFGSMANHIFDEVLADYSGIVAADSHAKFSSKRFLQFMGLEDFPDLRSDGRFINYTDQMSEDALQVLASVLVEVSLNLERFSYMRPTTRNLSKELSILSRLTLTELADSTIVGHIYEELTN